MSLTDLIVAGAAELANDVSHERFCVAEEHEGLVEVVERIVYSGEAGTHAAFDDHHSAGFIDVENWHPVYWAARVGASRGIRNVVRADHQCNIRLREFAVNFVQ